MFSRPSAAARGNGVLPAWRAWFGQPRAFSGSHRLTPRLLAAASAALVRSEIMRRSSSANH